MTFYAYIIDCLIEDEWRVHKLVISPPGVAVRDYLDSVEEHRRDQIRIRRITTRTEFMQLLEQEVDQSLHRTYDGNLISFIDGEFSIRE